MFTILNLGYLFNSCLSDSVQGIMRYIYLLRQECGFLAIDKMQIS